MVVLAGLGSLRRRHGLLGLIVLAAFMSCSMLVLVSGPGQKLGGQPWLGTGGEGCFHLTALAFTLSPPALSLRT